MTRGKCRPGGAGVVARGIPQGKEALSGKDWQNSANIIPRSGRAERSDRLARRTSASSWERAVGTSTPNDLDSREAVAIAPYVLPRTEALFGRASSRDLHRLYVSDLHEGAYGATIQFRDPLLKGDEAMLS